MVCRPLDRFSTSFAHSLQVLCVFRNFSTFRSQSRRLGCPNPSIPPTDQYHHVPRCHQYFDWVHGCHFIYGPPMFPEGSPSLTGALGDVTAVYHTREKHWTANPRYPLLSLAAQCEVTYFKTLRFERDCEQRVWLEITKTGSRP